MGGVWTLDDWNDIINQINELVANPDSGCPAVDPLESVEAPHKWSKADIQTVQDKLTEICPDNTFEDIPDKWKQSTIDEITEAIANGWCECECECSNAQGLVETYIGAYEARELQYCGTPEAPLCEDTCTASCRTASTTAGSTARTKTDYWALSWMDYCVLQREVDKLEDELAALQAAKESACASGPSPACTQATEAVTAKQEELDAKKAERDAKLAEANQYEAEAEAYAATSIALANNCAPDGLLVLYTTFAGEEPWADTACDVCPGHDPSVCQAYWSVGKRTTYHYRDGSTYQAPWSDVMRGGYTPKGSPYVTYLPGCSGLSRYACVCWGPSLQDCEEAGCPSWQTNELRLWRRYPEPSE